MKIVDNASESFPEKFLYHIWDGQHLKYEDYKSKTLKTVAGKELKIHFHGHYNTMSGADFRNALIEIDKQSYTGDIEIHINSSDWYNHQHDENPAYNSVVLHVVLKHNHHTNITLNEKNEQVEILELQNVISEDIEKLFIRYETRDQYTDEKYCSLFSKIRPEFLESLLVTSGYERLEKKIKRFEAELSFVSIDQLFYQSIFEALGYSKNKHQFYLFSKDNSWLGYKQKNLAYDEFVNDLIEKADFYSNKYGWYLFRIRPCNHPKTRLYQIAPLVYDSFSSTLTTEVTKLFSFKKAEFTLARFRKRIYEKLGCESKYTKYKLGKDRVDAIVINVFIPLLIIFSKITNDNELHDLCHKIYTEYPGLEENHISHIMRKYVTEEQYALSENKAITQQGLLNIYHKYCINHLCKLCKENMLNSINQD